MTGGRVSSLVLAAVLVAAACGSGDDTGSAGPVSSPPIATTTRPAPHTTASAVPDPTSTSKPTPTGGATTTRGGDLETPRAPSTLTPDDSGEYRLDLDAVTAIRLDRHHEWSEPTVDGTAVSIVAVAFESDPGYDEYQVSAREVGTATVVVSAPDATATFVFHVM